MNSAEDQRRVQESSSVIVAHTSNVNITLDFRCPSLFFRLYVLQTNMDDYKISALLEEHEDDVSTISTSDQIHS